MNETSLKRKFDGRKSDEPHEKLQKILENMQKNFHHVQKCVEFSKEMISECCIKLEELQSQMEEIVAVVGETNSNNNQHSLDSSTSNEGRKNSYQEIIEEITLEEGEKIKNFESRNKKRRTNTDEDEISIITVQKNNKCSPGPSKEITKISKSNRLQSPENFAEDVLVEALDKTNGVLSADELNTFLSLCEKVQDPVQLAKVSFTKDIKMLYFQLMTFHFHLKIANDVAEKEKGTSHTNRDIEHKVQRLIHRFHEEI